MTKANYLAAEKSFIELTGLKVGSTVKILRTAKDREHGWQNSWNKQYMDSKVGKSFTVDRFSSDGFGIHTTDNYYYPFFVLQVMETETPNVEIKLESGSYTAIIYGGTGNIKVGCQKISAAMVDKLHKASLAARKPVTIEKEAPKKKVATKKVAKKTPTKKATRR